jgi:hypothetical protein
MTIGAPGPVFSGSRLTLKGATRIFDSEIAPFAFVRFLVPFGDPRS